MKTYSLKTLEDKLIGKVGTKRRNRYEQKLESELAKLGDSRSSKL